MAKIKELTTTLTKTKVSRPGVHAKTKTSQLKSSKKYKNTQKSPPLEVYPPLAGLPAFVLN